LLLLLLLLLVMTSAMTLGDDVVFCDA